MQFHRSSSSRIVVLWLVGGLLLILLGTLAPFNFTPLSMGKKEALRSFFQHPSDGFDFYGNIVLFFPYGVGLGLLLKGRVMPLWMKLVSLVGLSFGLTVTVEVLQLFLPSRSSSATDIFTNTIGGTFSGLYVLLDWRRYTRQILDWLQWEWSRTGMVVGLLLLWVGLMNGSALTLQSMTDLTNWSTEFRLAIAQEVTGEFPWSGTVSGLSMGSRALNEAEVSTLFQSPTFPDLSAVGLKADLKIDREGEPNAKTRRFTQDQPPQDAIAAILQSQQFTLSTTIEIKDIDPSDHPRIVTISQDKYQRNVALLQEGDRLIVAVRSPVTGYNGDRFILTARRSLEIRPYRIVVTYREGRLRLYTASNTASNTIFNTTAPTLDELILKPEFTLFQYILPDHGSHVSLDEVNQRWFASRFYPIVFYAIWSLPLGILVLRVFTLVFTSRRRSSVWQMIWIRIGFMMAVGSLTLVFTTTLTTSVSEFSLTKWGICWGLGVLPMVWSILPLDRAYHNLRKSRST